MFPDPALKWLPYPSIMDGMKPPPFVLDRGRWCGVLNLIVIESRPGTRAYGVEIRCEVYGAFEEMMYSIAGHGDTRGRYDGGVYIKEAKCSHLLEVYARIDPFKRKIRHFSFVGGELCYETLGVAEPIIRAFASPEDAYAWMPGRVTDSNV